MASLKLSRLGRPLVIGIRREDPGRIWERRAPITPDDVHEIVSKEKAAVEVVACARRVFSDYEYKQAGARIVSRLSPDVDLIVGIKEPPLREVVNLERGRQEAGHEPQTFLMFSHTHKGQPYNTKLLSRFAAQTHERVPREFNPYPRLIDYELITKEDTGKRTVGFGIYAGLAGVLEGFSSMAHAHLKAGIASPFLYTPRPHTLPTLEHLRSAFRSVGKMIEKNGTPPSLGPVIVGVTGNGQVAKGCLSMLQELPIQFVKPSQLESLVRNKPSHSDLTKIYVCHAQPEDYFRRTDGRSYDRADYYLNPDMYESVFYHKIAPYLTLLFHGAGWSSSFPRLMTNSELIFALEKAARISPHHQKRFTNIADISCDIEGGLEFLTATTTLSSPSYEIRPTPTDSNPTPFLFSPHVEPPVVTMMAVDILPAAIPRDASYHFSQVLRPYILSLIERMREEKAVWEEQGREGYAKAIAQFAHPDSEVRENGNGKKGREDPYKSALSRAIIASGGELVGQHTWLQQSVDKVLEERTFRVDPDLVPKPSDGVGEELWAMLAEPQESQRRNVSKKEAVVANEIEEAVAKKAAREAASESDDYMEKLSKALNDIEPSVASSSPATDTGSAASLGKKKILMLGSGMVAGPAVDYLAQRKDVELVIGSNCLAELQQLSVPYKHVQYRMIDFEKQATYKHLVAETDVVISLLPAVMHPKVAKLCLKMGKHLVTASYVSDAMAELDEEAKSKGVLLLNEIGLDPGIDHLSAQDMIDRIHKDERSIISFTSFCGGLPALEDSFVPLRYKFSWRPQGVLTATLNTAKYRLDGVDHRVSGNKLLSSPFHNLPITPEFELEGLPNRYSLPYITAYHIRYPVPTFVRGTLRYPGFSSLMQSFKTLGLLNNEKEMHLHDWGTFVTQSMLLMYKIDDGILPPLPSIIPLEHLAPLQEALEYLGLAKPTVPRPSRSHSRVMPPLPAGAMTPLDIFAYVLAAKLKYEPHERDMVVLSHEIITERKPLASPSAPREVEIHTSTLITHGTHESDVGFKGARPASAMARTVGLPVALAALLIVDGKTLGMSGVHKPTHPTLYVPLLAGLEELGITMKEKVRKEKRKPVLVRNGEYNGLRVRGGRDIEGRPRTMEDALIASHEGRSFVDRMEGGEVVRDLNQDPHWKEDEYVPWEKRP